ncbi:hypothetical protein FQR65_LT00179 [Abscondita terminalis]|nr:hypothetical protein FQR65_LT00179 [Abscondita terminalis]
MNLTISCFLAFCLVLTAATFLDFKICKRSDPKIDDCLKNAIQLALSVLEKGVPELEIPPMQPISVPKWVVHSIGILNFEEYYENIVCYNHASSTINFVESKISDDRFWIRVQGYNPEIRFVADYVFKDAVVNGINISSSGNVAYSHYGYNFELVMSGSVTEDKGFKQLTITESSVNMTAENFVIVYKNENLDLSKRMSEFLTNNWSKLFDVVKYQFAAIYAEAYKKLANLVFSKVDFDELFPK